MGRGQASRIAVLACVVVVLALAPAGTAVAATPFYCDTEDYPEANARLDAPGLWSDGSKWSLGHAPTVDEDVCVGGRGITMDVDVEVRDLWAYELHVPAGRTLTAARGVAGMLQVDGTLRTLGETSDDEYLILHGSPTGTMTLDAAHPLRIAELRDVHDLNLVGSTRVEVPAWPIHVRGSLTGGTGSVLAAYYDVVVGTSGAAGTVTADLELGAARLRLLGDVRVTDVRIAADALDLEVEGDGSVLDHVEIVSGWTFVSPIGTSASLRATGAFDTEEVRVEEGMDLYLDACEPNGHGTSYRVEPWSRITFGDIDCVDAPSGFEIDIAAPSIDPFTLDPVMIVFDFDGAFDGGGALHLQGWVGVAGGRRIVDGATTLQGSSALGVRAVGPGTATVVDLGAAVLAVAAGAGATLRLESPRFSETWLANTDGSGAIEVVTDQRREQSIATIDRSSNGSAPVRYLASDGEYEPRRLQVMLDGSTWSPAAPVWIDHVHGWGTVRGTGTIDVASACGGTLSLIGDFTIEQQGTCGGTNDRVEVVRPARPPDPSRDETTGTTPPVVQPPATSPPVRVTRVVRSGTARANRLAGGPLADRLFGMAGDDVLLGGAGNDHLDGGAGNDRITCGSGPRDRAFGGSGNDTITCRDGRRGAVVDCGPGRDRAIVDRGDVVRHCEVVVRR